MMWVLVAAALPAGLYVGVVFGMLTKREINPLAEW
jgi:uncharacterized membrane-anchored protein YhcB (DUF1043 family)